MQIELVGNQMGRSFLERQFDTAKGVATRNVKRLFSKPSNAMPVQDMPVSPVMEKSGFAMTKPVMYGAVALGLLFLLRKRRG